VLFWPCAAGPRENGGSKPSCLARYSNSGTCGDDGERRDQRGLQRLMKPDPDDNHTTWRWALQTVFVLLWSSALIALYFGIHKPAGGDVVRATVQTAGSLVIWLAVTLLAAAVGRRLVRSQLDDELPLVRLVLSAGLGLGVLSILLMVLGLLGLLARWQVILLLVGMAALAWPALPATWQDVRGWQWPRAGRGWQRWFLFYGAASLAMTLALAVAPPIAWDSHLYHLTGPRLYLEAGRIGHPIDLAFLGYPALGQMQFLLTILVWSDRLAALFHFGYGLMGLVFTIALARRISGETAAWFAAAVYLSVPSLLNLMAAAYVDLALLFYTSGSFYLFVRWRDAYLAGEGERGWLVLLGLFVGFAGGLKYTAVAAPLALALGILTVSWRGSTLSAARRVFLVALAAVAAVVIWPFENWLTTGNPFYPFFFDDALYWDEWRTWWFDRPGTGLATTAPWRLITAPLEATLLGREGSELYDATVGPLLVGGLGLLAIVWRGLAPHGRAVALYMLLLVTLNYGLWLYGIARSALVLQTRLLFPIFGLLAALAGAGFAQAGSLRRPQLDTGWLLRVIVSLTLALLLVTQVVGFLERNPLPVLLGVEPREVYERRHLGVYPEVMAAMDDLPPGSRVVFLWEPRSYACTRVECWPDALLDRFLHHTQYFEQDAAGIAADWQAQGFTHILWYEHGMRFIEEADFDPLGDADLAVLAELQQDYLSPVRVWEGSYTLYELVE
jgi:hypothetical protein